jgi:hypothetical protein
MESDGRLGWECNCVMCESVHYLLPNFGTSPRFPRFSSLPFLQFSFPSHLKVHKHEIILNFFGAKSKPYMTLVNIRKNLILFLRLLPEFRCSNIFAVTEHTQNQFFVGRYPQIFFLQNVHFGLIR